MKMIQRGQLGAMADFDWSAALQNIGNTAVNVAQTYAQIKIAQSQKASNPNLNLRPAITNYPTTGGLNLSSNTMMLIAAAGLGVFLLMKKRGR
jgi:hypothetical protein